MREIRFVVGGESEQLMDALRQKARDMGVDDSDQAIVGASIICMAEKFGMIREGPDQGFEFDERDGDGESTKH